MRLDPLPSLLANYDAARAARLELDALYADGVDSGAFGFNAGEKHPLILTLREAEERADKFAEELARAPAVTLAGLSAKLSHALDLARSADPDGELSNGRHFTWPTIVLERAASDAVALLNSNWCAA